MARKFNSSFFIPLILISIFILTSCTKSSENENLSDLVKYVSVGFSDTESVKQIFGDSDEDAISFVLEQMNKAVVEEFEKTKSLDLKDVAADILEENNINREKIEYFKIYLSSEKPINKEKHNLELSSVYPSYGYESGGIVYKYRGNEEAPSTEFVKGDGDPYFPNMTDEELKEVFEKLSDYAREEESKGNSVTLSPEILEELGITGYNKENIENLKFQYNYYIK